jgi:hypothetical protein
LAAAKVHSDGAMKVPAQVSTKDHGPEDARRLQLARGLLFGIGGFDGNPTLAVLAESLNEEITAEHVAKRKAAGIAQTMQHSGNR